MEEDKILKIRSKVVTAYEHVSAANPDINILRDILGDLKKVFDDNSKFRLSSYCASWLLSEKILFIVGANYASSFQGVSIKTVSQRIIAYDKVVDVDTTKHYKNVYRTSHYLVSKDRLNMKKIELKKLLFPK